MPSALLPSNRWLLPALAFVCLIGSSETLSTVARGQSKGIGQSKGNALGGLGLPTVSGFGKNVTFEASYELEQDSDRGRVQVRAKIVDGWHMFSTTQPAGGPLPTVIAVQSEQVELLGPFVPDHAPDIGSNDVWPGLPMEEHHGQVLWTAPLRRIAESDPQQLRLPLTVQGQVCMTDGSCIPISEKLTAEFGGYYAPPPRAESLRIESTQAVWSATLQPSQVEPGQSAVLSLTAQTDPGYHVYPFVAGDEQTDYRTLIVAKTKSGIKFGEPRTTAAIEYDTRLDEPIAYHAGPVTWEIPLTVPENAAEGEYPLELLVGFMTCNDRACSPQSGVAVSGQMVVKTGAAAVGGPTPLTFAEVAYKDVADQPALTSWIDMPSDTSVAGTPRAAGNGLELWMVFAALAGGFILNFMPCVLPVIGLKLMSFVNQSGSSQVKVISLNLSYVAGIIAVMLVLAAANIVAKQAGEAFGWGQQFTRLEFQVPMAVLIFAMALSFLGVWEIPIPGFATSSKSGELMEQEGLSGAFFKGILTTLLATPCSGPFLGTLFGLTLTLSVTAILMLYILVGLGLGLPYLALCIYPGAIKLLPKPGAWMDTLKQVLAFPLLLTVVYFVGMIAPDYRIATLTLLIVVWFACWMIGRVPAYAEPRRLRAAWLGGLVTAALGAFIAFSFLGPVKHDVPWIEYDEATLAQHRREGKTVMVEFTARWCLTCQSNMKFAIDRPRVAQLVERNGVVPLLADWSEPSDEILKKIRELDSLSIPLLAIYPPDPQAEPIVLRDAITESQLLKALEQAGPSQPKTKLASTKAAVD
ncbi:MAG: thioredoxin family protein [Planctomycetales bacterium]|nr:thioredoxin family protein [Planctomycetales bacterium]